MIMTFTLGLASVFVTSGSFQHSNEKVVNLPTTESGEVIVVFPKCRFEMPYAGGSGSDHAGDKNFDKKIADCVVNRSTRITLKH